MTIFAVILTGCHPKVSYPGYTQVGVVGGETYFVDAGTIVRASVPGYSLLTGTQIVQHVDRSYTLGPIYVNCQVKRSFVQESTTFDPTGKVLSSGKAAVQQEDDVISFFCSKAAKVPFIKGPYDTKSALDVFLGADNSRWEPEIPEQFNNVFESSGKSFEASVLLNETFHESGTLKHLLVISSVPTGDYSCHGCQTLISALILKEVGDAWFEDSRNTYMAAAGSYGAPPDAHLVQMGPDKYGFYLESGSMSQGVGNDHKDYYAAIGPKVESVLGVQTSSSEADSVGTIETAATTTMKFGPSVTGGFYDVSLESHGTEFDDTGSITNVNSFQRCKMSSAAYECH
jgi:hypothetical protein